MSEAMTTLEAVDARVWFSIGWYLVLFGGMLFAVHHSIKRGF